MSTTNDDEVVLSRSSGDNEPGHYVLKVESFSLLSEVGIEKYASEIFEASGYKWRLLLYPKGNDMEGGKNHISLYLVIVDTTSLPRGWEVNVYLKFFVYDHVQENYLTIQAADGKKRRFQSSNLEWGFAKLLDLKTFKDGYLFQDTCVIGVEVFVTPKFVLKENCLSIIKPPTSNNSYTWTIHKFSAINEKSISSEDFKVGKIKWKLKLYPKHTGGEGKGTHISLFLSVNDTESLPLYLGIFAKYKFRLLDQAGTAYLDRDVRGRWFSETAKSWGFETLILPSVLTDKGKSFVVNDKLIVQVEFAAVGVIRGFA